MKKFKLKKLIVLAMLGALAGSVSVSAMENKNANNIIINKNKCMSCSKTPLHIAQGILSEYKANVLTFKTFLSPLENTLAELQKKCMLLALEDPSTTEFKTEKAKLELIEQYLPLDYTLKYLGKIIEANEERIKTIDSFNDKTPLFGPMSEEIFCPDDCEAKGNTLDEKMKFAISKLTIYLIGVRRNIDMFREKFHKLQNLQDNKNNKQKINSNIYRK